MGDASFFVLQGVTITLPSFTRDFGLAGLPKSELDVRIAGPTQFASEPNRYRY